MRWSIHKGLLAGVLAFLIIPLLVAAASAPRLLADVVLAQQEVLLQGIDTTNKVRTVQTDTSGRLITVSSTSGAGTGTASYQCSSSSPNKVTSVGVAAVAVPGTDAASRVSIWVCNSAENSGSPKVKCRVDGTAPVMGSTNAGEVLEAGDCVTYTVATGIKCIADTASTAVSTFECL